MRSQARWPKPIRCLASEQAFTLIEVMMAVLLTTIVVGAGFGMLVATEKATMTSGQIVDAQQGARLAMDLLSRDIKMAGFGWNVGMVVGNCSVPVAAPANGAPIVPVETNPLGQDTGPDGIRLVVPMTNTQTLNATVPAWTLSAPVVGGFTQIQLQPGAVADMLKAGLRLDGTDVISIAGAYSARVAGASGPNGLQLADTAPIHANFSATTQVFLLQCINYTVSNNAVQCGNVGAPCLMRGPVGANNAWNQQVPIADGVEDMQFAYACDGCTAADATGDGMIDNQVAAVDPSAAFTDADFLTNVVWNLAPATPNRIRLVRVNLVTRQTARAGDGGFGEGRSATRFTPAPLIVSDHRHIDGVFAAGDYVDATYSAVRRRTLTKTISTRNVQLCEAC